LKAIVSKTQTFQKTLAFTYTFTFMLSRLQNWLVNDGNKIIWTMVWIFIQIVYFSIAFYQLSTTPQYKTIRSIVSFGFQTARASAALITFNSALILFTVSRAFLTALRSTVLRHVIPFDSNIDFHYFIAYSIVFWSIVHTCAHLSNYAFIDLSTNKTISFQKLLFLSGPGATGILLILVLAIMIYTFFKKEKKYETFWLCHHLFVVFFGLTALHGTFCFIKADTGDICHGGPSFYQWILPGFILFFFERLLREYRARQSTKIIKIVQHPSKVLQIQIKKPNFISKPGKNVI
jgi:hypothetical protein